MVGQSDTNCPNELSQNGSVSDPYHFDADPDPDPT